MLKVPSRVAAKEGSFGNRDSIAPCTSYGFFAMFPPLTPWAITFPPLRGASRDGGIHFQKLICARCKIYAIVTSPHQYHGWKRVPAVVGMKARSGTENAIPRWLRDVLRTIDVVRICPC